MVPKTVQCQLNSDKMCQRCQQSQTSLPEKGMKIMKTILQKHENVVQKNMKTVLEEHEQILEKSRTTVGRQISFEMKLHLKPAAYPMPHIQSNSNPPNQSNSIKPNLPSAC